jgi:hypothetical protein
MGVSDGLPTVAEISGANAPVTNRGLLLSSLVAIPLIWIGGYAIYWAIEHQHREDASAHYEPIELARGAPVALPSSGYVSVQGRLLWRRTVALTKGSSSTPEYTRVPLVAKDWRDGEPVPFVAHVDTNRYLAQPPAVRKRAPRPRRWCGRGGSPGVPQDGPAHDAATVLLRLILRRTAPPRHGRERLQIYLGWRSAAACSPFMMGVAVLIRWNHAKAAEPPAGGGAALSAASCSGVPTFSQRRARPRRRSAAPAAGVEQQRERRLRARCDAANTRRAAGRCWRRSALAVRSGAVGEAQPSAPRPKSPRMEMRIRQARAGRAGRWRRRRRRRWLKRKSGA